MSSEVVISVEPEQEYHIYSEKSGAQFYLSRNETGELQIKCSDNVVEIDEEHNEVRVISGHLVLISEDT